MKKKFLLAYWTVRALALNTYIEWKNRRLETTRRKWQALKVGGGGVVPLGKVDQETAIAKTAKFGSVSFVDTEVAVVFYSDIFQTK
jgi:hypothetical protein